jgi:hypothetical protein
MRDVPPWPKKPWWAVKRLGGNPGRERRGSRRAPSPSFLNGAHGPAAHTEEKEPLAPNPNDRCADETHRLAATLTFHAWIGVLPDGGL